MRREKERDHTGMWKMDPLRGRKLRPLFHTTLRPQTTLANSMVAAAFSSCCLAHSHRAQPMEVALLPLRSQYCWTRMGLMEEQVRREGSRWNPTKEQLRALEELYARGTRTPPAHQIQLIAAQLRRYGRIEGKNVFYWFQNHKARERQRLRRQAEEAAATAASPSDHKQDSGGAAPAAGFGVLEQESKSWAPDKSCTSASLQVTSAAAGRRGEETAYSPWLLLHRQSWAEGDAAWQDTSRNPQPRLPRPAATSSSGSGSGGSSNHSNLELSRGRRTLAREFAEGEEPTTTLELFPLRSGNDLRGSSSPGNKPRTSPHVQYFQFL